MPQQQQSPQYKPTSTPATSTELPPLTQPLRPQMSQAQAAQPPQQRLRRGTKIRLRILIVSVIICIIVIGIAFLFRNRAQTGQINVPIIQTESSNEVLNSAQPITSEEKNTSLTEPIRDSDGDGLLDSEEEVSGTNPQSIDTDNDGLNDRQEIRVYQTDPKVFDSDGDGYGDGEEVRNFFNPKGSGKLIDESQLINELNVTP